MTNTTVSYKDFIDQYNISMDSLKELFELSMDNFKKRCTVNIHEVLNNEDQTLLQRTSGTIYDMNNKKVNVTLVQEFNIDQYSFIAISWLATYGDDSKADKEDDETLISLLNESIEHCPKMVWFEIQD